MARWLGEIVCSFSFLLFIFAQRLMNSALISSGTVTPGAMPIDAFYTIAEEAGCADDHVSWFACTWDGWKWWWKNRTLSNLLMDGPDLPASHRLRGRKQWDGAEQVIWKANGRVRPGTPRI